MIIYKPPNPVKAWIDFIVEIMIGIVTSVGSILVNAFFYEEDRSNWKAILKYFIGILLFTLLLIAISTYLQGEEVIWIEEIIQYVR